ncbi:MAG: hypothetical protein ABI813_01595 [Bacteroidota bacterium]
MKTLAGVRANRNGTHKIIIGIVYYVVIKTTRLLAGEKSALSPKFVSNQILAGSLSSALPFIRLVCVVEKNSAERTKATKKNSYPMILNQYPPQQNQVFSIDSCCYVVKYNSVYTSDKGFIGESVLKKAGY